MDKNDIIEYVMNTPHNTNRAVLSSMLNQLTEGGGNGGSSIQNKMLTVTVVNNSGNDLSEGMPLHLFTNDNGLVKEDLVYLPTVDGTINASSLIIPGPDGRGGETSVVDINLPMSTQGTYSISASDSVNCTLNSGFLGYALVVTDLTKDASVTLTVTYNEQIDDIDPGAQEEPITPGTL